MAEPTPSLPTTHDGQALTDADAFCRYFTPHKPRTRGTRGLYALLVELDPNADDWAKADWLESFGQWLHDGGSVPVDPSAPDADPGDARTARLRLLSRALRDVPAWRAAFAGVAGSLLGHAKGVRVFSDVGLSTQSGFWGEAMERVAHKLLPVAPEPGRLSHLFVRVFPSPDDALWLQRAPRDVLAEFTELLFASTEARHEAWRGLRISMAEAVSVLASRVCAQGLATDVRERLTETHVRNLPFLRLPRACEALALDSEGAGSRATDDALADARDALEGCRQAVRDVLAHLDRAGVSVDLVYRLEVITAQVGRLEELLALLVPGFADEPAVDLPRFVSSLLQAQYANHSLRALLTQSTHQLARKVIERTGASGEHYITETRAAWWKMLGSAAGGGLLTAGTAALKFAIAAMKLPMFFAGFFASLNYAGSFVLMQALGFTLATKQPSMTAAALARSLESSTAGRGGITTTKARRLDRLVDMMAQITRSQFAAAVGNVFAVIPVAIAFDLLWKLAKGRHYLDAGKAAHVVESLHLYESGTVPYAILTGVLLWVASVAAGWLENWVVYHKLPEATAHNRQLIRWFGKERTARLADALAHGVTGFGGNVALGVLLGVVPIVGTFFGLPLDVRHVTLSTGGLTLAACTMGPRAVLHAAFVWSAAGVVVIGLMNFGVSFVLALAVALRARDVKRADFNVLVRTVLSRLLRRPGEFIFPPASPPARKPAVAHGAAPSTGASPSPQSGASPEEALAVALASSHPPPAAPP